MPEFRGDEMMASTPDATVSRHPKPMQTTQADSSSSSITPLLSPETAAPSQSANGQQSLPEPSLGSASQSGGFGGLSAPINITTAIPSTKPSFKYYQRNRTRNGKGRHAHHQGYYQQSPRLGALSSLVPKVVRSIETSGPLDAPRLSNATGATGNEMLYSDMSEDDVIGKPAGVHRDGASPAMQTRPDSTRAGVHRKAITRPRNLLPKPKPFNRIRAQLLEETAPVEFDVRREAEVIRQVRDSEVDPQLANTAEGIQSHVHLQDSDMCWESPHADDSTGDGAGPPSGFPRPLTTFSLHSSAAPVTTPTTATSTGTGMFQFPRYETPPPPSSRHSSDMLMDTDTPPPFSLSGMPPRPSTQAVDEAPGGWAASIAAAQESLLVTAGSSTTSPATAGPPPLPPASTTKRRRDDFIDFNTFKRRAVSPSVSVVSTQSSPQVKPLKRPGSLSSESGNNSFGSNGVGGPLKRVGLQGMKEASDGFRDMKID
ncbi:hypothetical protein KEM52_006580 [Ascosphaera acerosa]|nr:hypothetical protein KEM52_006580 [Ascosphaera acerosa]